MLLEPHFSDSGRGPVAGKREKSLRGDGRMVRIENICATSKTAVETDRFAGRNFLLFWIRPARDPAGSRAGSRPPTWPKWYSDMHGGAFN